MSEDKNKRPPDYIRYSSIGIQMVLTIGVFVYLGYRLDKYFETEKPLWTAGLSLFGVVVAIIMMIRTVDDKRTRKPRKPKKPKK